MELNGQFHSPAALLLRKEPPVPVGQVAGWSSELVFTLWNSVKYLASAGNQTLAVYA
jgi:hypothetical protein